MRSKIITISIPEEFLKKIDLVAKRENRTRSEFLREAARRYTEETQEWQQIRQWGRKTAKKFNIQSEEDTYKLIDEWRRDKN